MSRPVALRASWRNDAAWLLRFEEAVEKDQTETEDWKREVCDMARKLAQKLLTAKRSSQLRVEGQQPKSRRSA
jgi:hypothetical protein